VPRLTVSLGLQLINLIITTPITTPKSFNLGSVRPEIDSLALITWQWRLQ